MTAHDEFAPSRRHPARSEVYEQVNWADQARVRPERPYRVHGPRPASTDSLRRQSSTAMTFSVADDVIRAASEQL